MDFAKLPVALVLAFSSTAALAGDHLFTRYIATDDGIEAQGNVCEIRTDGVRVVVSKYVHETKKNDVQVIEKKIETPAETILEVLRRVEQAPFETGELIEPLAANGVVNIWGFDAKASTPHWILVLTAQSERIHRRAGEDVQGIMAFIEQYCAIAEQGAVEGTAADDDPS